ncbi:MAG: nitrate reductase associated protein [Cyanobacteria bacterium J06598_3]
MPSRPAASVPPAMASPFFEFEQDFVGSLRCIPMVVRHRLDTCGVKLKLEAWNKFSQPERSALVEWPCDSAEAVEHYRGRLQALITEKTGAPAKTLAIASLPDWQNLDAIPAAVVEKFACQQIPLSLQQWSQLNELQRFALIKLSRSSHENNNFLPAVQEFNLMTPPD